MSRILEKPGFYLENAKRLVLQGKPDEAVVYTMDFLRPGTFQSYLDFKYPDGVTRWVGAMRLRLGDFSDVDPVKLLEMGDIRAGLLFNGTHEELTTEAFRAQLEDLKTAGDTVTVLDIGANLGYYVLVEANALSTEDRIYAIEPQSDNFELLTQNVRENRLEGIVEPVQVAIGTNTGEASLLLTECSNKHTLRAEATKSFTGQERVNICQLGDFLQQETLSPAEVDVVRMDLEGQEDYVLRALDELDAWPTLLFFELHPVYLADKAVEEALVRVEKAGYEPVSSLAHKKRGRQVDQYESFDKIRAADFGSVELVLRRQ